MKNETVLGYLLAATAVLAAAAVLITITVVLGQRSLRNGEIREQLATICIQNGGIWLDGDTGSNRGCLR